jgi:polysaccharide deacetylase
MVERRGVDSDSVLLIVSIDTEEDNWQRSRDLATFENIRELRRQAALFERLGVRPTYFTTYRVAKEPRAADVIREICEGGRGEIGAHLHPWNTPPFSEAFVPRNSMLKNLPADLQLAKLQRLTAALEEAFGQTPRVFRAGRYGLGRDTVAALAACGYRVDSSVAPFVSWERFDDGPSFFGAPLNAYRLSSDREVTQVAPGGDLLEIPLSCGFTHGPFSLCGPARQILEMWPLRDLHLVGLAARAGVCKRVVLSPEVSSVSDMLQVSRRLLDHGVRHIQVSWHSPSLKPGLSPFTATAADVAGLYAAVEAFIEGLSQITSLTFATIGQAAALLG